MKYFSTSLNGYLKLWFCLLNKSITGWNGNEVCPSTAAAIGVSMLSIPSSESAIKVSNYMSEEVYGWVIDKQARLELFKA